jgi:small Trp-rich protein
MPLVWIGLALIIAKWMEFGSFGALSWWWVLSPLAAALLWFEVFQPMLGMDKSKDDGKIEAAKKARIAHSFQTKPDPRAK